jgi:hypothetical protein
MHALKSDGVTLLVAVAEVVAAGGGVAQPARVRATAPRTPGMIKDFFTKMPPWQ